MSKKMLQMDQYVPLEILQESMIDEHDISEV